ncbi:Nucleolin [Tupaia chinensis]|uniref:Nucleolin n=1 Tax=Tupaia chinensis TaxID=246437 RepID=L9L2V8_TUPCH|nr:Nucleolin [Tupaia chinensis]
MKIKGRAIRLELQEPKGSPNTKSQPSKTVKGLSEDTTEETLKVSFDGFIHARTFTNWETVSYKGFGFVDFNSAEDAKAANEAMEDGKFDGNKVTLDWAKPKGEVPTLCYMILGDLERKGTWAVFKELTFLVDQTT